MWIWADPGHLTQPELRQGFPGGSLDPIGVVRGAGRWWEGSEARTPCLGSEARCRLPSCGPAPGPSRPS